MKVGGGGGLFFSTDPKCLWLTQPRNGRLSWTWLGLQGFWGSGENGYLFSGIWEVLVIILGEQAHSFGILGSPAQKQKLIMKSLNFV